MDSGEVEEQTTPEQPKSAKRKPSARKIIMNVSDTRYSVVRIVGRKLMGWKLSKNEEDENWDVWWTDNGV
jgi:tubulin polyglutamylase TTLL6/13